MNTNIYIVEDHPLMCIALQSFFQRQHAWQVCGMAATAQAALADPALIAADLVLIDVALPDMDGIQLISQLRTQHPTMHCLVFSSYQEATYIQRALNAGANGYVVKGSTAELAEAIQHVLGGEIYLSDAAYRELFTIGSWVVTIKVPQSAGSRQNARRSHAASEIR